MGVDRDRVVERVEHAMFDKAISLATYSHREMAEIITDGVLAVLDEMGEQAREKNFAGILIPTPKPRGKVGDGG